MEVTRRTLSASETLHIGLFAARPTSDGCGDVERQSANVVVLPFSGVFSKHDAPGRHVIGTPGHAVLIAAETPYRIGFPGAIGDRAITLRFDEALAPDRLDRPGGGTLASHGLLPASAMMLRNLLRARLEGDAPDRFEIETLGLDLLEMSLQSMRADGTSPRPAALARRMRAISRVKEAVAVNPAGKWSVAKLGRIANLSPFHLCHVFRQIAGISIYNYVLHERLARSLDTVLDGGDLTAIALDAGFASHSHFTSRFRSFFGCSPATLRRMASAGQIAELRKIMTARRSVLPLLTSMTTEADDMDIASFHASRRFAEVKSGRIAYVEQGQGPVALFVHGVPLNGYHWRHIIDRVRHRRRCIAIDLMGLGYTEIGPSQDVSFTAQAQMIAEVLDALGIEQVDLIANDSGGAIAQIFAAHHPNRLKSLVLTNCDVHDGWPPPQVLPLIERAREGTLAPLFWPTLERPDLARERYARGESAPLFRSYADPSVLTDEVIGLYLQPLLSSPQRIDAFQRYWLGFDNAQTVAIHAALKTLRVPTLIVWGLEDIFFDKKWAYWLKDTIPGAERVVEVRDARLFFPEDRPDSLTAPLLEFWDELSA